MRVDGLDELIKRFSSFGDDAMPYVKTMSDAAGKIVLDRARVLAPNDTGNLRKKIRQGKGKTKVGKYVYITRITVGKGAAYYIPLELGHKMSGWFAGFPGRVAARPFLRPAADLSANEIDKLFADHMNKALEKLGGR